MSLAKFWAGLVAATCVSFSSALPLPQEFPMFSPFDATGNSSPFKGGMFNQQQQTTQVSPFGGGSVFGSPFDLLNPGTKQLQLQQKKQTQQKADAAGVQDVSVGEGAADVKSNSNSLQKDGQALANSQSRAVADGIDQNIKLVEQTAGAVQSQSSGKGEQMLNLPGFTAGIRTNDQVQRQNSASGQVVNQGTLARGQSQFDTLSNTNVGENGSSQTSGTSSLARGSGIRITSGSGSSAAGQMAGQSNAQVKKVRL